MKANLMAFTLAQSLDCNAIERELDDNGFSIAEGILSVEDTAWLKGRLWEIAAELKAGGIETHTGIIDPTPENVRIYDLPDHDPAFLDLLTSQEIVAVVQQALDGEFLASNFTANIARPGAQPMRIHSDMALVFPEPWQQRWALNVIWCLDDICEANGATRYLPGSHRIESHDTLPDDAMAKTRPFEAPAGSIIVMDGRLWHTSGHNRTEDSDRALLFAYYSRAFIRPQVNWYEALRPEVVVSLTERQRQLFGFGPLANTHGVSLIALHTRLQEHDA